MLFRSTADAVRSAGRRAHVYQADLIRADACERAVEDTVRDLGRLDILVNMASMYQSKPFDDLTVEDWDAQLSVDLRAAWLCARAAVPHMRRVRGGRIINFADWVAASGRPRYAGFLPYYVAKAGVIAMTQALALELASDQILVNAVAPGPIVAPENTSDEEFTQVERATRAEFHEARTLGALRAKDQVMALVAALQSPQQQEHPAVRREIVESLGMIGDVSAGPALDRAARDSDRRIAQGAIVSIGRVGYRDARPAVESMFRTDRSPETRRRALEALSLMRDPGSAALFESLLAHKDDYYRETAAEGLARIGHDPSVLQSRYDMEKKPGVRTALAFALVAANQDRYFDQLANALASRQSSQAELYVFELGKFNGKLPELHRYLRSESPAVRARMAHIVGNVGDPSSRELIQELTHDKDPEVVREAIVALRKLT